MESLPPPPIFVGFHDLHGFKDFIGAMMLCLPDHFVQRDYLRPKQQMNFERAFEGLHYGVSMLEAQRGMPEKVARCRQLIEEARALYAQGDGKGGFAKMYEMDRIFRKIRTQ